MKLLISLITVVLIGVIFFSIKPDIKIGSVQNASEYKYTNFTATTTLAKLIKSEPGTLGSVVISTLGTGYMIFYDASSTLPVDRTVQATSSLPVLASISASQIAGTYTYDVSFYNGLIAVFSGTQGTSTVTWR